MIKRNTIIITGLCLMVLLCIVCVQYRRPDTAKKVTAMADAIAVTPFQTGNGWGYKVSIGGKPFINQDVIPGLPGNISFASREDALRVGTKVAEKLKEQKVPAVSREELIAMKIKAAMK